MDWKSLIWKTIVLQVLIIGISPCVSSGQGQLNYELYGIEEGLSNRDVHYVSRDLNDNIWIVTSKVEMYDGNQFYSFDQLDELKKEEFSFVVAGLQYNDSLLYLLDYKNLFSFNTNNFTYSQIDFPAQLDPSTFDFHNFVKSPHSADLLFFSRSDTGFYFQLVDKDWNRTLIHHLDPNSKKNNIANMYAMGEEGELWLLYNEKDYVLRLRSDHVDTFHVNLQGNDNHIIFSPANGAYLISGNGTIRIVDDLGNVQDWINLPKDLGALQNRFLSENNMLHLMYENALLEVDLKDQKYLRFDHQFFANANIPVRQLMEDKEGIKWAATEIGLLKINSDLKPFISGVKGKEKNIQFREIMPTGNSDVIIARMNDGKRGLLQIQFNQDNTIDTTMLFYPIGGTGEMHKLGEKVLYINNSKKYGIFYNAQTLVDEKIELPYLTSSDYHNQSLLINGVLHYSNSDFDIVQYDLTTKETKVIDLDYGTFDTRFGNRSVEYVRDKYYITGTLRSGVLVHDANNGALLRHYHMDSEPSLSNNQITSIVTENENILWVGTLGGGLNKIDIDKDTVWHFTKKEGLPNNRIASIVKDDEGNLWLGTYEGLSKFETKTKTFYNYFEEDGIANNEFNYLSSYKDELGMVYMGTLNGITKFKPSTFSQFSSLPAVQIISTSKYNPKLDSTITVNSARKPLEKIQLKSFENSLNVEFRVPSYNNTVPYNYAIKLEGLNDQWLNIGNNYNLHYPKLPSGNYNLMIKATLPNGVSTIEPILLKITVEEVFYKTWWFIALLFLSILAIFYAIYRARINVLKRESETRSRIASDLHDEIGSSMTRISLQMQLLTSKLPEQEQKSFDKIGKVVDQAITKLRDLVWSIDMGSDSWQDMIDKMEDFAFDTLLPQEMQFIMKTEGLSFKKMVKPLAKRNLYLIFKEAITNAAKYSKGNVVHCHLTNKDKQFQMIILDNGTPSETIGKGNGLMNLEMRAERLKGNVEYGFQEKGGFKVTLQFPERVWKTT